MALSFLWVLLTVIAFFWGIASGNIEAVSAAAMEGAGEAVKLALTLAGVLCLWNGVLEVMRRAKIDAQIARFARPVLKRLYPDFSHDDEVLSAAAANMSANLLGLGNAATPLGIKASKLMVSRKPESRDLCTFIVMNTASIQLVPATIAAVRAGLGAKNPFDILPAVWITSIIALLAGLIVNYYLQRRKRR